ncbi:hypothetical protein TWF730_006588 [Orbilia blumenaviensis]|uniref:Uncharacterized protein n=1 Tax=Orbilia blumenaviensis TaxID=1796055 RepID=A0AAV9VKZ8_9PEZI
MSKKRKGGYVYARKDGRRGNQFNATKVSKVKGITGYFLLLDMAPGVQADNEFPGVGGRVLKPKSAIYKWPFKKTSEYPGKIHQTESLPGLSRQDPHVKDESLSRSPSV